MAKGTGKKNTVKKIELTPEQQWQNAYDRAVEDLHFIPEPTYFHKVGDRVHVGNLKEACVHKVFENGKIYEIDYTNVDNNYGNPIETPHKRNFYDWLSVRKHSDSKNMESFIENDDIVLKYSNRDLADLFSKAYSFGVNFEPDYQRDYVWDMEDKIALIDSIFKNIDIGKFVFIHYNSSRWHETGFSYEILDGKQRMRAILDFYEDRFQYRGKFYSELSYRDKYHFRGCPIALAEVEDITEEQVLRYFLNLNTKGKSMDKIHLEKIERRLSEINTKNI